MFHINVLFKILIDMVIVVKMFMVNRENKLQQLQLFNFWTNKDNVAFCMEIYMVKMHYKCKNDIYYKHEFRTE